MNKKKAFNYFKSTYDLVPSTSGWYRFANPLRLTKGVSMAVNFGSNTVICHSTKYKSSLSDFIKITKQLDSYRDVTDLIGKYTEIEFKVSIPLNLNTKSVEMPEHFHMLSENVPFQDRAIKFLKEKRLDIDYLDSLGFGFCTKGEFVGRIIMPFINSGKLVYYIGRSFIGGDPKYKNPMREMVGVGKSEIFYNEDALSGDSIDLCEGVFDALTCGYEGVASLGWNLSSTQFSKIISSNCKRVRIVPDRNFYKKALPLAFKLMQYKEVWISNLDDSEYGDVNESGYDYLTFEKVTMDLLRNEVVNS